MTEDIGPFVRGFASIGEAFAYMERQEQEGQASLAPEQRRLTWGSYYVNFDLRLKVMIFCYCMTQQEVHDSEKEAIGNPASVEAAQEAQAELEHTMATITDSHERGYLFGWNYSVLEPEGELGSQGRWNVWPINRALFEDAKAAGWDPNKMSAAGRVGLDTAYRELRAHMLELLRSRDQQ